MKPEASTETIIDLKPLGARVFLLMLNLGAPLLIFSPLLYFKTLPSCTGFGALVAVVIFLFLYLLLKNCAFNFEEQGVRLPGFDRRLVPYANVRHIYTYQSLGTTPLVIEYVPPKTVFGRHAEQEKHWLTMCNIEHLSGDSARQLWELISSNLSSCEISADVQDRLVNWKPGNRIAEDWSIFEPMRPALQYLVGHSDGFCKIWLSFWTIAAIIVYPICSFSIVTGSHLDSQIFAAISALLPHPIKEWLVWRFSIGRAETLGYEDQANNFFFGTRLGQICLLLLLCPFVGLVYISYAQVLRRLK